MRVGPGEKAAEPTHRRILCQRAERVADLSCDGGINEIVAARFRVAGAFPESGSAASLAEQNRESGQARLTPFLAWTYKRRLTCISSRTFLVVLFVQGAESMRGHRRPEIESALLAAELAPDAARLRGEPSREEACGFVAS